jgi:hypothetical protein
LGFGIASDIALFRRHVWLWSILLTTLTDHFGGALSSA